MIDILRRRAWLVATLLLAGAFVVVVFRLHSTTLTESLAAEAQPASPAAADWPMYGGTPLRNLVNTVDKNVPTEWSVKKGSQKNVKWVAALGDTAYGGPTVAGGKVFVGTNNGKPRVIYERDLGALGPGFDVSQFTGQ